MNAKPTSVPSPNPNVVASLSPGLTRSDYPGWAWMKETTPTGLRQTRRARGCNPFRVGAVGFMVSQGKLEQIITRTLRVGSCRATLGFWTESFWDSTTGARQGRDLERTIAASLPLPLGEDRGEGSQRVAEILEA